MFPDNHNYNGHQIDNMHPFVNNNDIISKYIGHIVGVLHCKNSREFVTAVCWLQRALRQYFVKLSCLLSNLAAKELELRFFAMF